MIPHSTTHSSWFLFSDNKIVITSASIIPSNDLVYVTWADSVAAGPRPPQIKSHFSFRMLIEGTSFGTVWLTVVVHQPIIVRLYFTAIFFFLCLAFFQDFVFHKKNREREIERTENIHFCQLSTHRIILGRRRRRSFCRCVRHDGLTHGFF